MNKLVSSPDGHFFNISKIDAIKVFAPLVPGKDDARIVIEFSSGREHTIYYKTHELAITASVQLVNHINKLV